MRIWARARPKILCSNALRRLRRSWRAISKTELGELEDIDDIDDERVAVRHTCFSKVTIAAFCNTSADISSSFQYMFSFRFCRSLFPS